MAPIICITSPTTVSTQTTSIGHSALNLYNTLLQGQLLEIPHISVDGEVWQMPTEHGPRSNLTFKFYNSPEALYSALENCEVDLMCHPLSESQIQGAISNRKIQLAWSSFPNNYYELTINHNFSIESYPNIMSPTHDDSVRKAIGCLVDKDYIIEWIFQGDAERIDYPIPYALREWWPDPPYPHEYDPTRALDLLKDRGFNDTDGNGFLNYPSDWLGAPGVDTTVYPMRVVIRADDPLRRAIGENIASSIEAIGFAVSTILADRPMAYQLVFIRKDYNIYTSWWSEFPFYPPTLYTWYHSAFWCTLNIILPPCLPYGHIIDNYLLKAYYAQTIEDAIFYTKNFCVTHFNYTVTVPIASRIKIDYWAYKNLLATVNTPIKGLNNILTYLRAYPSTYTMNINIGMVGSPMSINPIYPSSWPDRSGDEILGILYPNLLLLNPLTGRIQPWVIKEWKFDNYTDSESPDQKTKITILLRKDIGIATPVNGTFLRFYNASDLEFSIWYLYAFRDSWIWTSVGDLRYTKIIDEHTIELYIENHVGLEFLYHFASLKPLPKYEILQALSNAPLTPLIGQKTVSFYWFGGDLNFTEDSVIQVTEAFADGRPIQEGINFTVRGGIDTYKRNIFVPLKISGIELPINITISYYYPISPPHGYYLGSKAGLNWEDVAFTIGSHYPSFMSPDLISLNKNKYFFLETPPLGDLNFDFIVDIYDLIIVARAFGSTGNGAPEPGWNPTADIATPECIIDIYDLIIIAGEYGTAWNQNHNSLSFLYKYNLNI